MKHRAAYHLRQHQVNHRDKQDCQQIRYPKSGRFSPASHFSEHSDHHPQKDNGNHGHNPADGKDLPNLYETAQHK
jgi:hypothetical protein